MIEQKEKANSIDWKIVLSLIALVFSILGFLYGAGQCNQETHPSWIIPILDKVCPQVTPTPPATTPPPIASEPPAIVSPPDIVSAQKLTSSDYGTLLYEETFDTDNGLWSLDAGGQIQNGSLTLPPGAATSNWNKKYSNFIFETAFQFINVISSDYSGMSVYLRYGPCVGGDDHCNDQVGLSTKGTVLAWNHVSSTKQLLAGTLAAEFHLDGLNKFTVIVNGSEFKVFVNDVFVRGFTDTTFENKSGNIVLDVDGTSIAFDYFRVYELP